MPPTLDAATRRALRARAHHLDPVVAIGQHGLTPAVIHEIDVALLAHELIKVRVLGDDRVARAALLDEIAGAVDAAPVQRLGKLLVLWRPNPDKGAAARRSTGTARNRKRPAGIDDPRKKSSAKNATGARGKQSKAGARKRGSGAAGAAAQARERRRRAEADANAPEPPPRGRARPEPAATPPAADDRSPPRTPRGRPAPPAGVPRAAQPRRRRAR